MDLPARVENALDDEEVAASVELGGEDTLYVTPTRTLIYRGQGFLSDDSVEAYPHDAQRVELNQGRRKTTIRLDYGFDGTEEFSVPADVLDEALHPVLAGVLKASGVTTSGETVLHTHRFSELTLVVTSHRVAKHVGNAVWDEEFEEVAYDDVTGLALEEGNVASQLVLETAARTQRVKVPNDQAPVVHQRVEDALCKYHGVADYAAFERLLAEEQPDTTPEEREGEGDGFVDEGLDPIETKGADAADAAPASTQTKATGDTSRTTDQPTESTPTDEESTPTTHPPDPTPELGRDPETPRDAEDFDDSPFESATDAQDRSDIEHRLIALQDSIDEQAQLLDEQQRLLAEIIDDLNRRDQ